MLTDLAEASSEIVRLAAPEPFTLESLRKRATNGVLERLAGERDNFSRQTFGFIIFQIKCQAVLPCLHLTLGANLLSVLSSVETVPIPGRAVAAAACGTARDFGKVQVVTAMARWARGRDTHEVLFAMQAEFSVLKDRVLEVVGNSAVGGRLKDVVLETDRYDDGSEFLRIILQLDGLDTVSDADAEALIESIEKAIGDLDERFPSVRFADVA